jgi:hypothetical protein
VFDEVLNVEAAEEKAAEDLETSAFLCTNSAISAFFFSEESRRLTYFVRNA